MFIYNKVLGRLIMLFIIVLYVFLLPDVAYQVGLPCQTVSNKYFLSNFRSLIFPISKDSNLFSFDGKMFSSKF